MININELRGQKLKKDLGVYKAIKRYHNKHRDGSGNFGFTIRQDKRWFTLDGDYNRNGEITCLYFGLFSEAGEKISINSYQEAIRDMIRIIMRDGTKVTVWSN